MVEKKARSKTAFSLILFPMKNPILLFCLFALLPLKIFGQTGVPASPADADPRLQTMLEKHVEYNLRSKGKGYRVQIYFGSDKTKAKEVKARFLNLYGKETSAYEPYEQPNFKIRVGDFHTRLEAYRFLKMIKADFPTAFIVESEIEYLE